MDAFGIPGPPQRIVDEMEAIMDVRYRKDVDLKPGAKEYLERLRGRGCRLCVATATAERCPAPASPGWGWTDCLTLF
ncbi:MAG: hypothetical protein ACLU9S_09985 [Oscillospiraceae bacterium]